MKRGQLKSKHQNSKSNNSLGSKKGKKKSAYNRAVSRNLELPLTILSAELPSEEELNHLFERFNNLYFNGKLKTVKIEYSKRMTCAGLYCPGDKLIKLSTKYHQIFPGEIEDTLKHEMIHIKHFFHDAAFKAEAKRIGASLKAKSHPLLRRPPKYVYFCRGCGLEYPRQKKMIRYSCGDCSANRRYDERFKLILKKTAGSTNNRT